MFERFNDDARRVVVDGQDEARRLHHNYIGTEHLLLGLAANAETLGMQTIATYDLTQDDVREQVQEMAGTGNQNPMGHIPWTPRAKKVLELSLREALQLGHNYIGTEHILLGLLREGEGVAYQILAKAGMSLGEVRAEIVETLLARAKNHEGFEG